MPKHVAHKQKIEIRPSKTLDQSWTDISDLVTRYTLDVSVGEITMVELVLPWDNGGEVQIEDSAPEGPGKFVVYNDRLFIRGVNISDHVRGYRFVREVGELVLVEIDYQADSETLRINGGTPWEYDEAQQRGLALLDELIYDEGLPLSNE